MSATLQLETDFSAVWNEPHMVHDPPMFEAKMVDSEFVTEAIPARDHLVSNEYCGLSAENWDAAIKEARKLGYPFVALNVMLVWYDEDGECMECELISRTWRAVN